MYLWIVVWIRKELRKEMEMKKLFLIMSSALIIFTFALAIDGQESPTAFVHSDMIEISYDGTNWSNASALVSNIKIVVGQVTAAHVGHIKRGLLLGWEGQLGSPHETEKVIFIINTADIPTSESRFYIRWRFGILYHDETTDESPASEASDVMKLIGKPDKAISTGAVNSVDG